jgi:hypothetical protein
MTDLRTACLADLLQRLRQDLGEGHHLAGRLELAWQRQDPDLVAEAMEELEREPDEVRRRVHAAILTWLFDDDPAAGLRSMAPASSLLQ